MKNLIIKDEVEIKESISIKSKEYYRSYLINYIIPPIADITLEYLNTQIELYKDRILVWELTSIFSIKDIPGNCIIKVKNEVNLIHEKSGLESLEEKSINIEWLKNYDLIIQSSVNDCYNFFYNNNTFPYLVGKINDGILPRLFDIIIIQPTKEKIILSSSDIVFFSGIVSEPIYLFMYVCQYSIVSIEGNADVKNVFIPNYIRETIPKNVIFDTKNNIRYSGGIIYVKDEIIKDVEISII